MQVIDWLDAQDERQLFVSAISIGEIAKGISKLQNDHPARAAMLSHWLNGLQQRFSSRIIKLDASVMRLWGGLYGKAEKDGKKLPLMDSLIVACAAHHHLTIVTRNKADFSTFHHLFDPWTMEPHGE